MVTSFCSPFASSSFSSLPLFLVIIIIHPRNHPPLFPRLLTALHCQLPRRIIVHRPRCRKRANLTITIVNHLVSLTEVRLILFVAWWWYLSCYSFAVVLVIIISHRRRTCRHHLNLTPSRLRHPPHHPWNPSWNAIRSSSVPPHQQSIPTNYPNLSSLFTTPSSLFVSISPATFS